MKRTNIYLPEPLLKLLKEESKRTGESVASIIRMSANRYFKELANITKESEEALNNNQERIPIEKVDKMLENQEQLTQE